MPNISLLIELIQKINKSTSKAHLDLDYDGREFHWSVKQPNITASEWTPSELREKKETFHPH
jgi:hypothetical protein